MSDDEDQLSRHESESNDDEETESEHETVEDAKGDDGSAAHGPESPNPVQKDDEDARSQASVESRETTTSDLFMRSIPPSPIPQADATQPPGLYINQNYWSSYDDYDVITVHGLRDDRQTAWKTENGNWWVKGELLAKLTTREIDFSYHTHEDANIFKKGGIAEEARKLLDEYVAMRRDLPSTETDRPVIWICHDIGGHIVKQALMIAAMQPKTYDRIALLTTCIIFLGVPHRSRSMEELEDQLHHLLVLPGPNDIKKGIVQKVRGLAEEVSAINTQFYESNINTRAQVINIFTVPPEPIKPEENDKGEASKESEGQAKAEPSATEGEPSKAEPVVAEPTGETKVEDSNAQEDTKKQDNDGPAADEKPESDDSSPDLPPIITPFPRYNALMGYPFETHDRYRVAISHLDLVKGDPDDEERWISSYSDLFNTTGFTVQLNYRLLQNQGNILAMVPPRKTTNLPFEPDLPKPPFITWIYEQEPYKAFRKKDFGPAVLYLHGGGDSEPDHATQLDMSRLSQTFYLNHDLDTFEERNLLERGIVYFEFNKRDSRYNNIRAMLVTFLNDIIWHFWDDLDETMTDIFENLNRYRSWTLEDLYHVFSHLRDFIGAESLTFFISRFDDCDAEERKWFLERVLELQSLSDAMYKIIISTSGPDEFLTKVIPESSIINLGKCPALLEDQKLASLNEVHNLEDEMQALLMRRTIYQSFEDRIKDLIDQCKEEPSLGHSILRWLGSSKRGAPRASLKKIIRKLSPVTPANLLKVFFRALGRKKVKQARAAYRWIKHAAEPLTPEILGQAIALTCSQDEDVSLQDVVDPFALRRDLEQAFAGLVVIDGRDVRFGHDGLYDMTDFDPEDGSAESSAAIHGQIAETCLRCLRMMEGQDILAATVSVEQYGGLEAGAIMLPRSSLAEYAVRFWAKHYILAGEHAPAEQALEFFQDKYALRTWAEADYVVSNAFTRVQYSYFSPLPYMTRLGLDDLALKYLEIQKSESSGNKYLQNHSYWDAITEAARNGNKNMVLRLLDIADMDESRLRDAIFWAASYGKGGALNDLIAKARELDGFSWPPLILGRAATAGLETLIRALADAGYNMNEPIMSSDNRPSIFLAVDWGQEEAVRSLIESKVDFTVRDKYENTPLLLACKRAKTGPVKLMLDAGVDLKALDKNGGTVVHCAVDFARSKVLEVLLDAGAEFNSGNSDPEADLYTRIPIVHGADRGYEQCVRILLEHNADAKADSPQGTALYLAVQTGHVEITRMLLEKGADPNQTYTDKDMLLLRAIATKKKDLVELLIDNPYNNTAKIDAFDPSGPSYNTPLVRSIENNLPDIVKLLLDKNADVNFVGEGSDSALLAASYFGYVDITKELLARNADMTWHGSDGWTPLHAAYGNPEILEILLEKGADINGSSNDGSVVMIASRWGHTKSLKYLLGRTPKPDLEIALQNDGHVDHTCTALLIACRYGQAECVKLLLEAGAKVDHKTDDGSYALELCLERGGEESEDTLRELLKFSPNLKDTDSNGDTVLHSINGTTPLSVVQLLVEKGAPANAANKDGSTPLSVAVGQGNKEVARYLVQDCKVNVNVYGPKFGSALHLAAAQGDLDMVKLLIEAKADHSAVDRDYGESVLYTAFSNYDYRMRGKIVRYLVETAGVDVNARGGRMAYPIIRAAAESNENLLKYLIRRQADFNVSDDMGRRPIHLAAATGENSVMALIRAGAELNVRDKYGRSPVHFAAATGDVRVLEILLKPPPEEGFQTGLVDVDGWTPLMWACRSCWLEWNRQEILDKLIDDSKETLWARSKDNEWSPLKLANYHGWADEFKERLAPPEDQRTRTDRDGQEITWNSGFHKTREAIIRFGASCASCMNTIRGIQWKCVECSEEFNLCFKCFPHRSTMHDKEHHFEEIGPQFEAASSRASSVARSSDEQSEEESEDDEEKSEEEESDGEENDEGSGEDNDDDD